MTVLLSLKNFNLVQGQATILKNISLDVQAGEKIALVGPSGAGKSSLIAEIYRRLPSQSALCPQQLGLVDALSAYHNIYMAQLDKHLFAVNLWNLFFPLTLAYREIEALTRDFGLRDLLRRPVARLSGGERQRVALARACYRQQPLFLGDEPVSSLDPEQGRGLLTTVCGRHQTAVVALHNPALALSSFERVIGLNNGVLVFDTPAAELSADDLARFYRGQ